MFERYTEKARRVIFFGRYEASQFGSRFIESEHLLLGLLREDKVVTDLLLRSATAVESIRMQIQSQAPVREKISVSVDLPLSEECKRILAYAAEEADRLGHKHIGTDHLYLGMLRDENCFAAKILRERGVSLDQAREWIANPSLRPSPEIGLDIQGARGLNVDRYSLKAVRAIIFARSEAGKFASSTVEAEHLLLGVLLADQAIAKQLLHSESAVESIRKQIESNTEKPKREKTGPLAEAAYLRKSIQAAALSVEQAIAKHEFEKARLYSEQERERRGTLRLLGEKHGFDPSVTEEPSGRLSDQCQRVLSQGAEEATLLKQRYIGTEHLLLGILREEKSFAADILHDSGLQLAQAREEIARWNQEQGGDHV